MVRTASSDVPPRGARERMIETYSSNDSRMRAYKGAPCYRVARLWAARFVIFDDVDKKPVAV